MRPNLVVVLPSRCEGGLRRGGGSESESVCVLFPIYRRPPESLPITWLRSSPKQGDHQRAAVWTAPKRYCGGAENKHGRLSLLYVCLNTERPGTGLPTGAGRDREENQPSFWEK